MNLRETTPACLFRASSCLALLVAFAFATPASATPLLKLKTAHATSSVILIDDVKPPLPVPADAEDLSYDASSGSLEFTTKTKVKELAATFRDAMKALGWEEEPTVIDKDTMAALTFSKGDEMASITLMSMGDHTQVSADGLATEKTASDDSNSSSASADASSSSNSDSSDAKQPLVAEDHNGLPVPTDHSMLGDESSIFRHSVNITTHATVKDFVDFYRAELGKKGFTEKPDVASVKDDAASLVFDTPTGPLTVQITQQGDDATAVLSTRDKDCCLQVTTLPQAGPGEDRPRQHQSQGGRSDGQRQEDQGAGWRWRQGAGWPDTGCAPRQDQN